MEIKYSKLHPHAKEPFRANTSDAGYDLFSTDYLTLEPLPAKAHLDGHQYRNPRRFLWKSGPKKRFSV